SERARRWKEKQGKKRGEGKALAVLAARLGRAVYHLWRKAEAFDEDRFWAGRPAARKARRVPLLCPAPGRWPMPLVDFRLARSDVRLAWVLGLLNWRPRERRGQQVRGACPLHGPTSPRGRSFSTQLGRGVWQCFRCGAAGNALDLWARTTGLGLYPG